MPDLWHPFQHAFEWFALKGDGYQFFSGIGSGSPIIALILVELKRHNCHVKGCWKLGHVDPSLGFHACKTHHSRGHLHGIDPNEKTTP